MSAELDDSDSGDTREQQVLGVEAIEDSGEMLSATGITQVLAEQTAQNNALQTEQTQDQTQLQAGGTMLEEAEVKQRAGAETELMAAPVGDEDFDLDLNDL